MKKLKFLAILLVVIMTATFFASCAKPSEENPAEDNNKTEDNQPEDNNSDTAIEESNWLAEELALNTKQYQEKLDKEMTSNGLLMASNTTFLTLDNVSQFLGRGYNVVLGHYYNANDVNTSMPPALKMDALVGEHKLTSFADTGVAGSHYMGTTFKEYQSTVSQSLSIEGSYGLFSKVSADFNITEDTDVSSIQNCVFINELNYLRKERQSAIIGDNPRAYATEHFIGIIDAELPKDANERYDYLVENLFEKYGTHILTSIVLGGKYQMSFVYRNTLNKKMSKIAEDLTVTYSAIKKEASGTVSKTEKDTATEMISNSTFSIKTYGGSIDGIGNDYESAVQNYNRWSKAIDDGVDLTLCDVNPKSGSVPMPVWEFAKDKETKIAIQKAFTEYAERNGGLFKGIDDELGKTNVPKYVEKIYIGSGTSREAAINDIRHQISLDYKEGKIDNVSSVPHSYDLKRGTGGDFVLIGYSTTYDKSKAITDIRINMSLGDETPPVYEGYECINKDLNDSFDAKRKYAKARFGYLIAYPYQYVYYSKLADKGPAIEAIGVQSNTTNSFGDFIKGWSYCCGFGDRAQDKYNVNLFSCSRYETYICSYSTPTVKDD